MFGDEVVEAEGGECPRQSLELRALCSVRVRAVQNAVYLRVRAYRIPSAQSLSENGHGLLVRKVGTHISMVGKTMTSTREKYVHNPSPVSKQTQEGEGDEPEHGQVLAVLVRVIEEEHHCGALNSSLNSHKLRFLHKKAYL